MKQIKKSKEKRHSRDYLEKEFEKIVDRIWDHLQSTTIPLENCKEKIEPLTGWSIEKWAEHFEKI